LENSAKKYNEGRGSERKKDGKRKEDRLLDKKGDNQTVPARENTTDQDGERGRKTHRSINTK